LIRKLNYLETETNAEVLDSETYLPLITIKPRTPDALYKPPFVKRIRTPWNYRNSLFSQFRGGKGENKTLVARCFETDWAMTSLEQVEIGNPVLKDKKEIKNIKKILLKDYT